MSDTSLTVVTQEKTRVLLGRLWRDYIREHKGRLLLAVLCMVVSAASVALQAWMMQPVLDDIFVMKKEERLAVIAVALVLVSLVKAAATYGQTVTIRYMGQHILARMQKKLFAHLIRADLATFHDQSSGKLISRFTNDIVMMRESLSQVLTTLARDGLSIIFLVAVMIYQSAELALIAVLVFPVTFYPVMKMGKRMRKLSGQTQVELGTLTSQLDEVFQGVPIVKAYAQEAYETERVNGIIDRLLMLYNKAVRVQAVASPLIEVFSGLAVAGVIGYGGFKVLQGETTPGAFFSFIAAMLAAYRPLKSSAGMSTRLQEALAAAARLFGVLDIQPRIIDRPGAGQLRVEQGEIRLDGVRYHYTGSTAGLQDISLRIPARKTVALVGASGSGKSTVMRLLLRFYDVDAGHIRIDGQDVRDVTQSSLRQSIALVAQESFLFDDTIRNNIAYGRPDATQAEIVAAAQAAAAHAFIQELPQGYDTMVGQHGVKLSGGQRQRIAIARAVLKNAPILLLDEATSALDTESERQVQEAFERLRIGRTTLVIAHRLSTIRHADLIYVMENGQVVEVGTHEELLAQNGRYQALCAQQFVGQEEGSSAA